MTRPVTDERDPAPQKPWEPTSSEWARRQAREAVEAAVRSAKERRKREAGAPAECRRCGDTSAAGCEDWDCHEGWGPK